MSNTVDAFAAVVWQYLWCDDSFIDDRDGEMNVDSDFYDDKVFNGDGGCMVVVVVVV